MTTDPAEISFAIENGTAAAIDRLAQVLDFHLAHVHDQLQHLCDVIQERNQP